MIVEAKALASNPSARARRRPFKLLAGCLTTCALMSLTANGEEQEVSDQSAEAPVPKIASSTRGKRKIRDTLDGTALSFSIGLGGTLDTGNTQTWAVQGQTNFRYETGPHDIAFEATTDLEGLNADPADPDSPYDMITKSADATLAYVWFFTRYNGLWASATERWDPFSGFDTQLTISGGYLRALIRETKHLLTTRVGYAYTWSAYSAESTLGGGTASVQGLIAAAAYENLLSETMQFNAQAEYIINMNAIAAQDAKAWQNSRVSFFTALVANVAGGFALQASFQLRFENKPAASFKTDTETVASVIYNIW